MGRLNPPLGLFRLAMSQKEPANRPKCLDGLRDRVETESSHLDQPGHVLSGSSGSDPVYKISGSDVDSALDYADQSNKLSVFDDDDGSVSPDFLYYNYFVRLTAQLEYFDCSVLG